MENKIHYIPNDYPKCKEVIKVIIHLKNGNISSGMFYWNGGKPTFASYGSDVTDNVIGWQYIAE